MTGEPWDPESARNPDTDDPRRDPDEPGGPADPLDPDDPGVNDPGVNDPGDFGTDEPVQRAPGANDDASRHYQMDSAGGGYGSHSGVSSGGTGDGETGAGAGMDDGTTSRGTGATGEGPTSWVRDAPGGGGPG